MPTLLEGDTRQQAGRRLIPTWLPLCLIATHDWAGRRNYPAPSDMPSCAGPVCGGRKYTKV